MPVSLYTLDALESVDENELFDEQFDDMESSLCWPDMNSPFDSLKFVEFPFMLSFLKQKQSKTKQNKKENINFIH